MNNNILKAFSILGIVLLLTGFIGEIVYYGFVFEILMWGGVVMMAVSGQFRLWGE